MGGAKSLARGQRPGSEPRLPTETVGYSAMLCLSFPICRVGRRACHGTVPSGLNNQSLQVLTTHVGFSHRNRESRNHCLCHTDEETEAQTL